MVPTPAAHGRQFAVCVRALGRIGVSYHALQHAYTSTGASTRTSISSSTSTSTSRIRTRTSTRVGRDGISEGDVGEGLGDGVRGGISGDGFGGSGGGTWGSLSTVLTVVSPHLTARSLSTLLHGLTLLAANITPTPTPPSPSLTVTPPPPASALDARGQGLNIATQGRGQGEGLSIDTAEQRLGPINLRKQSITPPPPLVTLPPAVFQALVSVHHTLTPQGVALAVYSLGKLGYTWDQLDEMGEADGRDEGVSEDISREGVGVDDDEGDGLLSSSSVVPTPLVTKALLSAIAREAPRMNAQVQGLANLTSYITSYIVLHLHPYPHSS